MMKRRSFLKGFGAFLCLAYANPIGLVSETILPIAPIVKGNYIVSPDVIASEALSLLEDNLCFSLGAFQKEIIEPGIQKLADDVDKDIFNNFKRIDKI